jgi:MOSC domain-containing protein YiiM
VCDRRHHGGDAQAVYAYAREDLDWWEPRLDRTLPGGVFGENLTTLGLDVNGARIGERWRIGREVILETTSPRIPCGTFAKWLGDRHWVATFRAAKRPGAYLRVIEPGAVVAGDPIEVIYQPEHDVTVALMFRALTSEPELLPVLAAAGIDPHGM